MELLKRIITGLYGTFFLSKKGDILLNVCYLKFGDVLNFTYSDGHTIIIINKIESSEGYCKYKVAFKLKKNKK